MSGDDIGRLRHRVELQRPERSDAEGGGALIDWQTFGSTFAEIVSISGNEIEQADGVASRGTHRITMRYRADIDASSRILSGNRVLNVIAVLDKDGRKRWLHCVCEEELP